MNTYVVQSGDTLTKIAEEIYGDGELWRLIYQENRKTLKSPDKIQVGQKLKIPDADTELVEEEPADEEEEEEAEARPTLRVGATDRRAVKALQSRLVTGGYDVAIDGSFGPGTKAAVLDVQENAGLSTDGVVGPATWSALDALAEESGDEQEEDEEEDEESDDDDDDDDDDEDEDEDEDAEEEDE